MEKDKTIYNCHTHIFTIDHVPNKFGRQLLPVLYKVLTIKLVKWFYKNFTSRGNPRYRRFRHRLKNAKYAFLGFLEWTVVLHWIYLLVFFVIRWAFRIVINFIRIDFLFSKAAKETFKRYAMMGRYSMYEKQSKIFSLLANSYPADSRFVVLPMDMDYMEAGAPKIPYRDQLQELSDLKASRGDSILPFIFLHPNRIQDGQFYDGKPYSGFVKDSLASGQFSGIKIYPALGYFPFDKSLIDMYLFAQENEIPIMTHCIQGTVFFRGDKKKEWDQHPILTYNKMGGIFEPIPLPQSDNYLFTTNFTHPLNYHCLMNEDLLARYLGVNSPLVDLRNLKICLAHFGGEDQWQKYMADGWIKYNNNIFHGDLKSGSNTLTHGNQRTIWWDASWLSIIYDLMIKYDNLYADISFILYEQDFYPLLKYILQDTKINKKVLFGTDYYLTSQKNTEKELFINIQGYLGEELWYKISNENPKVFLSTKWVKY